jgi:hypothetical protein
MHRPFQVFIGYDSKEPVAYHVLAHSILRRASIPVSIAPVALSQLRAVYTRERGPLESTEFSLSRFLVPFLSHYAGFSLFLDCDMLCQTDLAEVLIEAFRDTPRTAFPAVWCVQHDYTPKSPVKFLDQPQTVYPRKNWSSVMLFNNAKCRRLTPAYVNSATGLQLHRFLWCDDDDLGALPLEWNWLVGEYAPNPAAKLLHYTLGGPWFEATHDCDHAAVWRDELAHLTGALCPA